MSTGRTLPLLPFWVRDHIGATRAMSLAERGAYCDLLFLSWDIGALPVEVERLARMVGATADEFAPVWQAIASKFERTDAGLVNRRLEEHRAEVMRRHDAKARGAVLTNAKRHAERVANRGAERDSQRVAERHDSDTVSETPSASHPNPNPNPKIVSFGHSRARARSRTVQRSELHEAIVAAYHEALPDLPAVKIWTEKRRSMLDKRIAETCARGPAADQVDYWRSFFSSVAQSDFLTGKANDFRADFEWCIRPENFAKIVEGRYQNRVRQSNGGSAHAVG